MVTCSPACMLRAAWQSGCARLQAIVNTTTHHEHQRKGIINACDLPISML